MVFVEEHHDLVQKSNKWVKEISGNYIVAATLISGVTFATCYQIPGGYDGGNGRPIVGNRYEFDMFAITALVSFCSSVTSLAAFLSIYGSQSDRPDMYWRFLPWSLCLGLASLFLSVVSMLISFCAAHTFELFGPINKSSAYVPLYVGLAFIPLYCYAITQIPLYCRLLEYVKDMMPPEFSERKNKEGKTPWMVFVEEHLDRVQKSNQWVKEISGNYIVAATLISCVTFATCYQIPGGYDGGNGRPIVGKL
ncbi:uncharacterized protein LOC114737261 [Neltuma alba]|uniref:uncharacterized protein LOC114737261 n=1 Tax=Neltuma alba TaxID=207710 RepID=UPI0010A591D8|nr:uncharacterized protein LOC114737261 [Prosopis alba]